MLMIMLLTFLILLVCAKLMSLRLPFYGAAILAVASLRYFEHHQAAGFFTQEVAIQLAVALVLFFLLDRAEGKFLRWLFWFAVTCAVFWLVL